MSLHEKAILIKLSFTTWQAKKIDRKVTQEVADIHNLSNDAGKYGKNLIARKEIKKIMSVINKMKSFHNKNTMKWGVGIGICPSANYMNYANGMRKLSVELDKVARTFKDNLPALIEESKDRLQDTFDPNDYPSMEKVEGLYKAKIEVLPVPSEGDFRVEGIDKEDLNRMKSEIKEKIKETHKEAMKELYLRLFNSVKHMAKTLGDVNAKFHSSLIGNIEELVELLPRLNFDKDKKLTSLVKEAKKNLSRYNPDELKHDKVKRKEATKKAQALVDKMSQFI